MSSKNEHPEKKIAFLVEGCKQGNLSCQRQIFELFAGRILTVCRRYENRQTGAKDILQETFIKAFDKIGQFDPQKGRFEAWLKRIAINTALKSLRGQTLTLPLQDADSSYTMNVETSASPDLREEQILQLIKELPTGYRTVFNLYVIDGYSHADIAKKLSISTQTSKSQLSKAKAKLRLKIQSIINQESESI
ncbi:MAG: RNA polymerase sigma factor [Bacteroidota bacterium]